MASPNERVRIETPSQQRRGSGGNTYVTNISVSESTDRRTADQIAQKNAEAQSTSARRNY
jgi:hypothetical protein